MTATKRKPKPITANPLFPLVTGLWFATLLGLGSFATAPMLLEGPVLALGIPALIPAAAPPLGFTTRIIFAVVMMGFGAIFGYVLGRFLGREKIAAPIRARGVGKNTGAAPASSARRPINAAEDLGAPLDTPFEQDSPARRRPLAQTEEPPAIVTPAFLASPVEEAPVVAEKPVFAERQVFQPSVAAPTAPPAAKPADPLDLDLLLEEAHVIEPAPFAPPHPPFAAPRQAPPPPVTPAPITPAPITPELEIPAEPAAEAVKAAPAPFAPPSLANVEETPPRPAPEQQVFTPQPPIMPAPIPPAPKLDTPTPPEAFLQARAVDATPLDRTPLENLGLVQLIERLALAISRRKAPETSLEPAPFKASETVAPAPAPVHQAPMARFEKSPDVASATDSFVVQPAPVPVAVEPERVVQLRPAALQPPQAFTADDEAEDEEPDAGLERFLRMSPLLSRKPEEVAEAFRTASNPAPEPEVAEDCYPSLLDMAPVVARREPLRIDDSLVDDDAVIEPVVVFPGQEAPWQQEAAKAAQSSSASSRPFARPSITPVPGSPLASPGRAAPSAQVSNLRDADQAMPAAAPVAQTPDAEEADRALRAALATLQRMTARG